MEFTQPLLQLFMREKTTHSSQWLSLHMDKYHCWSIFFGPLLFSIFINDLSEELSTNAKLFADNTSLLSAINDLSEGLSTNAKLFADNTSLFFSIHNSHTCAKDLSKHYDMIQNWAFQWEINFNADPTKQAGKSIFSRKTKKLSHVPLVSNNTNVNQSN